MLTQYGFPVPRSNLSIQPLGGGDFGASCFFGITPEVGRIEVDTSVSMLVQYGVPFWSRRSSQIPAGESTGAASCVFSFVVPTLEVGRTVVLKSVSMLTQYGFPVPRSNLSIQPLGGGDFGASCFFGITPEVGRIEVDTSVSMLVQYGVPFWSTRSSQIPGNSIITAGILLTPAPEIQGELSCCAATCRVRPCHSQAATLSAPSTATPIRGNTAFRIECKDGCRCVEFGVGMGNGASNSQAFAEVSSHFCNSTGAPFRSPSLPWTSMHWLVPFN